MNYEAAKAYILEKLEQELSDKLYYHGIHHTLDVLATVEELCEIEEVTGTDLVLVRTAALYHDAGFLTTMKGHESEGCNIAKEALTRFGYSESDIELICGMIMATKIPQSPNTLLEQIICDADLDYLGREDFYLIGNSLYEELKAHQIIEEEKTWNRIQVKFLESHFFHTQTNIARRNPIKEMYLEELKRIIASYDS